jgi:mRNA interferase MazF
MRWNGAKRWSATARVRRGDVWWVDFDPALGSEIRKTRPAVIVSNDIANAALNRVQVVPLTSSTDRIYPSEAVVSAGGQQSKAMADQLTTVSKERIKRRLGALSRADMQAVDRVVKIQLGLPL